MYAIVVMTSEGTIGRILVGFPTEFDAERYARENLAEQVWHVVPTEQPEQPESEELQYARQLRREHPEWDRVKLIVELRKKYFMGLVAAKQTADRVLSEPA
jgi:hypothetical protein